MPNPERIITANGRAQTITQWHTETGIPIKTIASRLDVLRWTPERAVSERSNPRFRRGGKHKAGVPRPVPPLHQKDGKAFCRWRAFGKENYRSFGTWGSPEATAAYRRFASEWMAGAYEVKPSAVSSGSIAGLVLRFLAWAEKEYRKGGKPTSEVAGYRAAMLHLNGLYGATDANTFTPDHLRAVRECWIKDGLARTTVNVYTFRVVRCFWWGVGQMLVKPDIHGALRAVEKLKPGRTAAPDHPKIGCVPDEVIEATLAVLSGPRGSVLAAMVGVQRLTGMRPQHICEMTAGAIDRTEEVWVYTPPPTGNKTHHLGISPRFYLGKRAQELIAPLLAGCGPGERVFAWQRNETDRRRPISRGGYCVAIRQACRKAGVPFWHPHQLRHSLATEVAARTQSVEHAAAAIGDTVQTAMRRYVHLDWRERIRREIAGEHG